MQSYAFLYKWNRRLLIFVSQHFHVQFPSILRSVLLVLLLISSTFHFPIANSQESSPSTSAIPSELSLLSDIELLKEAQNLRVLNPQMSHKLAYTVLASSQSKGDDSLAAQAYTLLARLAQESTENEEALEYFLQASNLYKHLNNKRSYILSSVNYIEMLLKQEHFTQADKFINNIIPYAQKYGDKLPIARTLMVKGDSFYRKKRFADGIDQYMEALNYLEGDDDITRKYIGDSYTEIAQSYKRLKNRKKTALFYTKALDVYSSIQHKELMARTLNTLAEAERYLGNLLIALDYSTRSLEMHKQINDPEGRAKALSGAGTIYRNIGRYEKSIQHFYDAHSYYKEVNDIGGIAKTSNQMGLIYTRLKQFDLARSFYQLTIGLPAEQVEQTTLASALREMAVIELNAGNFESAMDMSKKAKIIYQRKSEKTKESLTARIIANVYRGQGEEAWAIQYYKESISLAKEIGNLSYQIKAQNSLAGIMVGRNTEQAIKLLKDSLAMAIKVKDKEQILYAYRKLRHAEKRQKNIAASLRYAEKEIEITKSIQKEKDDKKLILAKANLHSHKLEVELESLKEKARFDQLELAKKNNEIEIAEQESTIHELELIKNKYATIALSSLLVICLFMVVYTYHRFVASKKRNKELDYLATHDPLTSCYNRRILFEILNRDFADKELLGEYCIIMADIDHFKEINDTYGHGIGDTVLSGVAHLLQHSVRQNDIAARYGGEEFCIVLPGAPEKQALIIAESMRTKVEATEFNDIKVTCSFGVTSIKYNAKEPTELIEQADLALYQSKSLGRNKVTLWEDSFKK